MSDSEEPAVLPHCAWPRQSSAKCKSETGCDMESIKQWPRSQKNIDVVKCGMTRVTSPAKVTAEPMVAMLNHNGSTVMTLVRFTQCTWH